MREPWISCAQVKKLTSSYWVSSPELAMTVTLAVVHQRIGTLCTLASAPWTAGSTSRDDAMDTKHSTRAIAIYGWGLVAPGARNIAAFRAALARGESTLRLASSSELGRGLFAVGDPDFDFEDYRSWVTERFGEARFNQLKSKMGDNALFAIGAFIQALGNDVRLEAALKDLDYGCHVYVGSGVGDLPESYAARAALDRATRLWNRFWADRTRCAALRAYLDEGRAPAGEPPPPDPSTFEPDTEERFAARSAWDAYWAARSDALARFERAYAEIERIPVGDDAEKGPLHAIRARQRAHRKLLDDTGCPPPPWESVDPKLVWAIQNVPAAQISMLLGTHGPAWAPVAACSTFGVALKCARDAIMRGEARAAILGTTDPRPDPALISAFHRARLTPATGEVNHPFTSLLGTHVAGGACIWIIADVEYMRERGLEPVGPMIEGVAVSSDAEHIITPSATGPKRAIRAAFAESGAQPEDIAVWDMHATGTPGDVSEMKLTREFIGHKTLVSARKGMFGHGMANAGGWELTALAMGLCEGRLAPTTVRPEAVHPALRAECGEAIVTGAREVPAGYGVKLTLGIGGVTACIVLGRKTTRER